MAAADVLAGVGADVVGFDRDEALEAGRLAELDVEVHLGQEEATLLQGIDLVVKSPGVPGQTLLVEGARERDIPVWSEIELGSRLLDNPILGVTGTNGKTTTSELLGAMFRAADTPVEVAGNVGRPLTSLVGHVTPDAWIVCELSSFQLEDVHTLEPRVGVLLNLEPDHLDRHGTFDAYSDTKLRMFEHQSADDTAIVPRGFGAIPGSATRVEFAATTSCRPSRAFPGRTTARTPSPPPSRRARLGSTTRRSRKRCTPSRASRTASSSSASCAAFAMSTTRRRRTSRPRVGRSRRSPVPTSTSSSAAAASTSRTRLWPRRSGLGDVAYLIGEAADEIARSLVAAGVPCIASGTLEEALDSAANAASAGDVVLLSPACASFDQFRDFEARGDAFRELVEALA